MARFEALRCQGARCGHIDGKARCGAYVLGEELDPSFEAAAINASGKDDRYWWARGYREGYRLGAEGEPLPVEVEQYEMP